MMANSKWQMAKQGIQRRDAKSAERRRAKPLVTQRESASRASSILNRVYFGTKLSGLYSDEWYTPPWLVGALGRFDLDPCAGPVSSHATRNIRRPRCGLKAVWKGRVWLNPPYSTLHDWLSKFLLHGNGIALVNARTDAGWFQAMAARADGLLFLKRRVEFVRGDGKGTAHPTSGSCLVAIGRRNASSLAGAGLSGVFVQPRGRA